MGFELVDTHCHLDFPDYEGDTAGPVGRAVAAGVTQMVTIGTTPERSEAAVRIAERHPEVFAAVGIHPSDLDTIGPDTYDRLLALARHPRVVGWGECGLDYARAGAPREVQLQRFREQIELAAAARLPLLVHNRDAHDDVLATLRAAPATGRPGGPRGILHCFSGDLAFARACADLGFLLSVPGIVTFKNAAALREVVAALPLDLLVLETDAPFLAPEPHRGRRNEPAYVVFTARRVAELKRLPVEAVAEATTRAARAVFGLPAPAAAPGAEQPAQRRDAT
ncbi:MAG TPA: TatD family hydrolase, partial [Thermodesulfobacteriota bacterium]|nr:TatD family hydrolase [Thermodesulfobacteriota bacterium]